MNIPDIFKLWGIVLTILLIGALATKPELNDFMEFVPGEVMKTEAYIKNNITVSKEADYLLFAKSKMYDYNRKSAVYYNAYLGNFYFADSQKGYHLTRGSLDNL